MGKKMKFLSKPSKWLAIWLTLTLLLANLPFSIIYAETTETSSSAAAVQATASSQTLETPQESQTFSESESQETAASTEPVETVESESAEPETAGAITGTVWLDENEDGVRDAAEHQISAVKMYLVKAEDKTQVISETLTDDSGGYTFAELDADEYHVAVGKQTLDDTEYLAPIASRQTGSDNKFDTDHSSEQTLSYTENIKVAENDVIADVDAGLRLKPQIESLSSGIYEVYDSSNALISSQETLKAAADFCNENAGTVFTILLKADDPAQGAEAKINSGKIITLTSVSNNTITQNLENFDEEDEVSKRHIVADSGARLSIESITLAGEGKPYDAKNWGASNGGISLKGATLTVGNGAVITKTFGNWGGAIQAEEESKVILKGDGQILSNQASDTGGGILAKNSTVELFDTSSVTDNIGRWSTGGICLTNESDKLLKSSLTINSGSVTGNRAKNYEAGGIKIEKGSSFTMNGGTIVSNIAENDSNGGGIYVAADSSVRINAGEITKNTAKNGGGIYHLGKTLTLAGGSLTENIASADGGGIRATGKAVIEVTGEKSTISGNRAAHGGGISANDDSTITMDQGLISSNTAAGRGGGVNLDGSATFFTMSNGEISSNTANQCGGVLADKATVEVENVAFNNNQATGNSSGEGYGGGLLVESPIIDGVRKPGKAKIIDSTFSGNTAYDGGGVYVSEGSQELQITNSVFENNEVRHYGGGLLVGATDTVIANVKFTDNHADRHGGGIKAGGDMTIKISDSLIQKNEARYGGGLSANDGSNITMDNTEVVGNKAFYRDDESVAGESSKGGDGGGLNIDLANTVLTIEAGRIEGNVADSSGGGIFATAQAAFTLKNVPVMKNSAVSGHGGGIFIKTSAVGEIITSSVDENTAAANGGGIRLESNGKLTINQSSISRNTAPYGGGVSVNSASTVEMKGTASKISDNNAALFGGGVNVDNDNTIFTLVEGSIDNNAARNGGGVFASNRSKFIMTGGEITQNTAANNGAGLYLQASAALTASGGTISKNEAKRSGGGIFTEDYSYNNPVDADNYYKNITITGTGEVAEDNRSQAKQDIPAVTGSLKFDKNYLNDHRVNYFPDSFILFYDPNGGGGEPYQEPYPKGDVFQEATIISEIPYTPPQPDYVFLYWSDNPDGTGKRYSGNGEEKLIMDSDKYLYAIWGPPTPLSGTVFLDKNHNGECDETEGLENREVTLYKKDESAPDGYIIVETTKTNQDGNYYFAVRDEATYKISVKKVDGEYGKHGFVKKGEGAKKSHVNQDGFSDDILIDIENDLSPTRNAGYVESVVVTGVKLNTANWLVYITVIILLGVVIKRMTLIRKNWLE